MKKLYKILLGLALMILGWLSVGIGFAEPLGGHPYNTIVFLLGVVLSAAGFAVLISPTRKKTIY